MTYEIVLQHVIDLRIEEHANTLELDRQQMRSKEPSACQLAGEAAHHAGFEGLLAPSATGEGDIAVVFLDQTLPDSVLRDLSRTRWKQVPSP